MDIQKLFDSLTDFNAVCYNCDDFSSDVDRHGYGDTYATERFETCNGRAEDCPRCQYSQVIRKRSK